MGDLLQTLAALHAATSDLLLCRALGKPLDTSGLTDLASRLVRQAGHHITRTTDLPVTADPLAELHSRTARILQTSASPLAFIDPGPLLLVYSLTVTIDAATHISCLSEPDRDVETGSGTFCRAELPTDPARSVRGI